MNSILLKNTRLPRLHYESTTNRNIRPIVHYRKKHNIITTKVSMNEAMEIVSNNSYIVTKGIFLFGMFYFSLNWLHYKKIREDLEKDNDE